VRSLFKRYREPIFVALLLAAPFLVFVAKARRGASLNPLDKAVVLLTAPVEHAITAAAFGVIDAWKGYIWLHGVREENETLRRDLSREHALAQRSQELLAENQRLKGLLDFADKQRPLRMTSAAVIAVGASPHSHTLRIARGTNDGVQRGAAVIAPDGIVGTVAQTTAGYSDVQLITSPLSAVPALSQRTRSRSTVKGIGDITRGRLEYALRSDDLQDGDLLLTAGGSGSFPKGLHIGRVTNVQRRATGMFLSSELLPSVDFSRLDEVMVVITDLEAPLEGAAGLATPLPAAAGSAAFGTGTGR
jgi:rod shape-determining protein MreC